MAGGVVVVAVGGAMLIGWLGWSEGIPLLAAAILVALVPAANFVSDGHRTALHASRMERMLDVDEDLYDEAVARRQTVRTVFVVAAVVAVAAAASIAAYAIANAGTERSDDDDRTEVDDRDDDSDDDQESDDDDGGEQPDGQEPEEQENGSGGDDD